MMSWEELKEKGNAEFKAKNFQSAISIYTDAISINADQEVLYANRSLCHKSLNNYRAALGDINKAIELNGSNVKNLKRKSELCVILGNLSDAENMMSRCVNLEKSEYSHKTELNNIRSLLNNMNNFFNYLHSENFEKAEESANSLINFCHGYGDLKYGYLECLINNNKCTEATSYWNNKLSDAEKSEDEFIFIICKAFYYEGNYDKAKGIMRKLLNRVNDNQKYNKMYQAISVAEREKDSANNLFKAGKYDEAIDAYTKLSEIDAKNKVFNSTVIANRALCKSKLGKTLEALDDMKISLEINNKYVKGFIRRAGLNLNLQQFDQARADYSRVLELEPSK